MKHGIKKVTLVASVIAAILTVEAQSGEAARLMAAKSASGQKQALITVIGSARYPCSHITSHRHVARLSSEREDYWYVKCGEGEYGIMIENNARMTSRAMPCTVAKQIGLSICQ
jgi:hypothetical protein